MTDAELLQQCKDEVAVKAGYKNWHDLKTSYIEDEYKYMHRFYEEVAALAIQKAREEAVKDLNSALLSLELAWYELRHIREGNQLPDIDQSIQLLENKIKAIKSKKLTAPGR